MFFVVFSTQINDHFIVPAAWIKDLKFKNHVNRSLNKNQLYRCYYSTNGLLNGMPNGNIEPKFETEIAREFPCTEGCYTCYLVYFSDDYDDAEKFMGQRRWGVGPKVYNERRQLEKPIPVIDQPPAPLLEVLVPASTDYVNPHVTEPVKKEVELFELNSGDQSDFDRLIENFYSEEEEEEGDQNTARENTNEEEDEEVGSEEEEVIEGGEENFDTSAEQDKNERGKEDTGNAAENSRNNTNELFTAANNQDTNESDDEVVFLIPDDQILPGPKKYTHNFYMKRENDAFSGNLPYNDDETGGRVYECNGKQVEIPFRAISKFLKWNNDPKLRYNTSIDEIIVRTLLLKSSGSVEIFLNGVNDNIKIFIRDILRVRIGNDKKRLGSIDNYIDKYVHEIKNRDVLKESLLTQKNT